MRFFIGIDNGISGAFAILNAHGDLMCWAPMPIQKSRKGNEVDVITLKTQLEQFHFKGATVIVEEPGGSKSARAASSMAGSFHAIRAMLDLMQLPYHRVTPQSWQKVLLRCKAGDTKPAAERLAKQLWPEEKWLRTARCSTPHDGGIDSALLAFHLKSNLLK